MVDFSRWSKNGQKFIQFLFILLVAIPIANPLLFQPEDKFFVEKHFNTTILRNPEGGLIPQTEEMRSVAKSSRISKELGNDPTDSAASDRGLLSHSIGTRLGIGTGSHSVIDSYTRVNLSELNTMNSIKDGYTSQRNATFSIDPLVASSQEAVFFQIQEVIAQEDWRAMENNISSADSLSSTSFVEAGQKFEIKEDYANITEVSVFLKYVDAIGLDGNIPHGNVSIHDDNSGEPGKQLGTMTLEEGFGSLDIGPAIPAAWISYRFSVPINLTKGSYWLVLNDTGIPAEGSWEWYAQEDTSLGNAGDIVLKTSHVDTWSLNPFPYDGHDIISAVRILPTDGNWNNLTYTSPSDIKMNYTTTEGGYTLSSFSFEANNTLSHEFNTTTSVSFSLLNTVNYAYSGNPINGTSTYRAENGSLVLWNITFSTIQISTSDAIKNRTITIDGIPVDWNGSRIYWNNSDVPEYPDLINDFNVTWDGDPAHKYTHGNTTMVVNVSTLTDNVTWHVWFEAPNYLLNFTLGRGTTPFIIPYEANATDLLNLTFYTRYTGNLSYWIDFPNGSSIARVDINGINTEFWEEWDIIQTLDPTINVNGTYWLQAFWSKDNSTKVGTFVRYLDLFVNTSLSPLNDTEILIGQSLNLAVNYRSTHNGTDIKGALIWANASWPTGARQNVTMNQLGDGSYNASFSTTGQPAGYIGTVTVNTRVGWFVNRTQIFFVKFVENSSLFVDRQNLVLEWRENATLRIDYLNSTNGVIFDGIVKIAGNVVSFDTGAFFYSLNTTDFGGIGSYMDIPIVATHSQYLSRQINISLTITSGETSIEGKYKGQPQTNNTLISEDIIFAANAQDTFMINFRYHSTFPIDLTLNTTPVVNYSAIQGVSLKSELNLTWTIIINPDSIGTYSINVSFSLANYNRSLFNFKINVIKAPTEVVSNIAFPRIVYFTDNFVFYLQFQSTAYNEPIPLVTPTIDDESKITFLNNDTEKYWFRFNTTQLSLGLHSLQISFSSPNYESSEIGVEFEVIEMSTLELSSDSVHLPDNGTVLIEDLFPISIDNYLTYQGENIGHLDEVNIWLNGTPVSKADFEEVHLLQTPFSLAFSTSGWQHGFYNLTFQLVTWGYQTRYFTSNITLRGRPIEMELVILPGTTISQGENLTFIIELSYHLAPQGGGSSVQLAPLGAINVTFYIMIENENGSQSIFECLRQTNSQGEASYIIPGSQTLAAYRFSKITIQTGMGLSSLPYSYTMSPEKLESYNFLPAQVDITGVIIFVLIIVVLVLVSAFAAGGAARTVHRKREKRAQVVQKHDVAIERSFEDIKSIKAIVGRVESGLPFYYENTTADIRTDPHALSGMSAAISSFMQDVSGGMSSRFEDGEMAEQIEIMSRHGLHLLMWNGEFITMMIISDIELPDYFRSRLAGLGNELEFTFKEELKEFYSTEQIPSSSVRKIVHRYIPLHYFSAFILNEGVITLRGIKFSKEEKKMISLIKGILFEKNGMQFLFSEQIISHLSNHFKRSKCINFLDKAIEQNLLIEFDPEDILHAKEGQSEESIPLGQNL
ncbi:MAG: hypothetical protein ACFFFG_06835 [Candidatus Thorarchaeota archaeon]